jgi:hypothetical protein
MSTFQPGDNTSRTCTITDEMIQRFRLKRFSRRDRA